MKFKEKHIQIILVIITLVMTILRFLLNEKGRITPDSIRYMRSAHIFPAIDNTTAPLGYPLSIKFFTFFGADEFWSSKIVGIFAFLFIVLFSLRKNFYTRESIITCSLFSFLSLFASTLSEALVLPFIFIFLYISDFIIKNNLKKWKAVFYLSLILILLYNVRYSSLFFIGATGLYGVIFYKKKYSSVLIFSAAIAFIYVVLYKFLFIDYFNENYVNRYLEIGLTPSSKLLTELFQGLATAFNPFIHMANPSSGIINYVIYGLGLFNIFMIVCIFIKNKLSETESFFVFTGVFGIVCSYFIQYFYSMDPIDYRLLAGFNFLIWLVYFRKLFESFDIKVYIIGFLSIMSGALFTWLSKGNYLENRKIIKEYLKTEKMEKIPLTFYLGKETTMDEGQVAELIGTVNPNLQYTIKPSDTLKKGTLTGYKVLQKIKIDKNKYQ